MGVAQDVEINLDRNVDRDPTRMERDSIQRTTSVDGIQETPTQGSNFLRVMKQSVMHIMAIFIFVYVGVEVTIGGPSFPLALE
jgi:fucose permease